MSWVLLGLQWYGVLVAISWGFAPWVRMLAPSLPDRAVVVARPVGLLATVYPLWLLSSISGIPYVTAGLWATVLIGAVAGWTIAWRRGQVDRRWLRCMVTAEAISLLAFAVYAVWRGYAPQILSTEKPMDIAFLTSSAVATSMPPPDPWMSGESINYYYLGYLLQGAVTRMSGVVPSVGFNLALATTFSMAVTASFGVAFALVRRWASGKRAVAAGALAVGFLVLGGNLYSAEQFIARPSQTIDAGWWDGVGWDSSRIVVDDVPASNQTGLEDAAPVNTINEFPSFSFVLGDLHPHLLALPFTLVAIYLAYALWALLSTATAATGPLMIRIAVCGGIAGSLYMLNSWDFPTYLLVTGAGAWFGLRHVGQRVALSALGVLAVASVVLWLPFFISFTPPIGVSTTAVPDWLSRIPIFSTLVTALGSMRWEHTSSAEFLTVFGVPYCFALWFLGHGATSPVSTAPGTTAAPDRRSVGLLALTILGFGLFMGAPVIVFCGLPLILAMLLHPARRVTHGPATLLFSLGFVLILGTEFFYIQDVFGNRMNTLFKIYYQAWTLFGIATAVAILTLWRDAGLSAYYARRLNRPALTAAVLVALAAALIYPVLSASDYPSVRGHAEWVGLDGMAYIGEIDTGELAAMRWIRDNADHNDVLLEALGCSYQVNGGLPTSGVSAFSGVPTVLGWPNHERQWHLGDDVILAEQRQRAALYNQLYSLDGQQLRDEFGVTLIYVGPFERSGTPACDSAGPYRDVTNPSFPGPGWDVAFSEGDATIYARSAPTSGDVGP